MDLRLSVRESEIERYLSDRERDIGDFGLWGRYRLLELVVSMAGNIPVNYNPSDPSANAMQMGGMFNNNNNNNNQFFVNYPPAPPAGPEMGSSSASASASTFATIRRRQHCRRFLRRSIARPPFYQPIPQPAPTRPPRLPPIPRVIKFSSLSCFLFCCMHVCFKPF